MDLNNDVCIDDFVELASLRFFDMSVITDSLAKINLIKSK